jgi:hypothetical protein
MFRVGKCEAKGLTITQVFTVKPFIRISYLLAVGFYIMMSADRRDMPMTKWVVLVRNFQPSDHNTVIAQGQRQFDTAGIEVNLLSTAFSQRASGACNRFTISVTKTIFFISNAVTIATQ